MQTASSSSLPPTTKHPQTSPKCVQPPSKEIERIHDPKKCSTVFSKRHKCILKKAYGLFELTGAHVAVIMFSPKGKLHCFGKPSVEEVFSEYLRHNGCVKHLQTPPHPLPPSIKHPQTPPKCVPPPPKEIKRIDSPKRCSTAFSKRHKCILKKASELFELTGAHVTVIMFSPKGKLRCFGKPSVEDVFSEYLRHNGLSEWMEECDSCAAKEDCASLIKKLRDAVDHLLKKLKDFENNPPVNAGAGDDSGVGVDCSSKASNDDKISFSTSLFDSAAGGESSGVGLVRSDLDDEEIYGELENFVELEDLDISTV